MSVGAGDVASGCWMSAGVAAGSTGLGVGGWETTSGWEDAKGLHPARSNPSINKLNIK